LAWPMLLVEISMPHVDPQSAAPPTRGQDSARRNLRALEKVRVIFSSLSKYISAKTIYSSNNPIVSNFADAFHRAFREYFDMEKELTLTIEQNRIKWRDEIVYDNDQKNESLAFLLYRDGVGEITFQSSVKPAELEQFVDLLRTEIYTPSAHLDIVGRLWQSEFADISYRVFDESTDGSPGEGQGTASESRKEPMLVNDHPVLTVLEDGSMNKNAATDPSVESLGTYFRGLVEHIHPHAAALEKELRLQELLEFYFILSSEELESWRGRFADVDEKDKLLRLLDAMLDFTQMRSPPPVVRDVLDIIERVVRHVVEVRHVPTLTALFHIHKRLACSEALALDFEDLPNRIHDELTNSAFLISLGKIAHRSNADAAQTLEYFRLVGKDAVPGVCELIANLKDASLHKHACDTLLEIAGNEVVRIVNDFNLDNPHEAKDAVYLLRHFVTDEIPPIIRTLMSSPDIRVREHAIEYLALISSDEAAGLLCKCLEDGDVNIRTTALTAVERSRHPLIVNRVTAMCFAEDIGTRSPEELERMFRAVGKLAGAAVLDPIRQMTRKKAWLPFGKARGKHDKLLAITALRHIPGNEASNLLVELANDGDNLVRTKALYVLKQRDAPEQDAVEEEALLGSEKPIE
jgi:hypothetical protein